MCDEASDVFSEFNQYPVGVDDNDLNTLDKFVVMMHDRSVKADGVNDIRLDMFAQKQRPHEAVSPTRATLLQLVKCDDYQAVNDKPTSNTEP